MTDKKNMAQEVLGRMKEAYKVRTNAEFSSKTGVPQPTISNWVSRGSIPFRYIYECSQSTGADIDWLSNGNLANARIDDVGVAKINSAHSVYTKLLENGGQTVLQRILMAYGFTLQKQLGELLGISSGTMSTWIRREFFPGDVVVACALDTGVNLEWLATGKGEMRDDMKKDKGRLVDHLELFAGQISDKGKVLIDNSLIPVSASYPVYLSSSKMSWIVDRDKNEIASGTLLLNVDGALDVYNVSKIPGNKITVCNVDNGVEFTCGTDDVKSEGRVLITYAYNG